MAPALSALAKDVAVDQLIQFFSGANSQPPANPTQNNVPGGSQSDAGSDAANGDVQV